MTLLLIHAGGTIGMIQTATGFAPAPGVVEDHIRDQVESGELHPVDIRLLEPLIDSANATPVDWDRIARIVHEEHERYDAFVVTHGTDTLAYTSAALCYALEGLMKPVILTGSMLPLTVEGSDGPRNLRDAMRQALTAAPGVRVQFAGRLLHGARTRKTHSRNLDAFAADPSDVPPFRPGPALRLHSPAVADIAVLAVAPGMSETLVRHAAALCDGIVLRCYGSGTVPQVDGLRRALATAWDRQCPVVAVSQCPEGGLALGTYAAGEMLAEFNVVDGRDMTIEAAYAKLAYVLAETGDFPARLEKLQQPVCGELTIS